MSVGQYILLMLSLCAAFFQTMSLLEFHALVSYKGVVRVQISWVLCQLVCLFTYYLFIAALVGVK